MLNTFQTCEATHLDSWLLMTQMAYWLLYVARDEIEQVQCPPWQKYLNNNQSANAPPKSAKRQAYTHPCTGSKVYWDYFLHF